MALDKVRHHILKNLIPLVMDGVDVEILNRLIEHQSSHN